MAGAFFRSGAKAVPVGATSVTLSGLSLPFTPETVVVSLRQPETDADIISAYVTGTPSSEGFTVALSASPAVQGYVLDWTALGGEIVNPSADSLSIDYNGLVNAVARFLGYDAAHLTTAQTAEVDGIVQSGVRQFYWPPAVDGMPDSHEWSFMKILGSVEIEPGITEYNLPDGFGRIFGQLQWPAGMHRPSIPIVAFPDLRKVAYGMFPHFAAVESRNALGSKGQLKRLHLSSSPDVRAVLVFRADADTGPLSADARPYPLGGAIHAECVLESCLAVAEQRSNDETGNHTAAFMRLLAASIRRDRESGAQVYGPMACPADKLLGY